MHILRRLYSGLTGNLYIKLISLAVAVLLWFALVDAPLLTTYVAAPVEFQNFPAGLDVGIQLPDRVQLQVRGPRDALAGDSFARTAVVLDLGSLRDAGERTFDVPASIVGLPARVEMMRAIPYQLRVVLERHVRRSVPVRLRFSGPVPPGYRISKHAIEPDTLIISGPESQVKSVDEAQCDPLDFGTMDRSVDEKLVEARLHTFVDNPRVRIDSASIVSVKVFLEKIKY
jgi:YbbR domain-containing protein